MKWSIPALSLMFGCGVMVGIAASPTQPLRAADHLPVYTVYEANVTDPEGYKNNFLKVIAPKLEQHGIKYLVRGGGPKALVGEPSEEPARDNWGRGHGDGNGVLERLQRRLSDCYQVCEWHQVVRSRRSLTTARYICRLSYWNVLSTSTTETDVGGGGIMPTNLTREAACGGSAHARR